VYLSFETIKKIKSGNVLINRCRVVYGYVCVSVEIIHVYIYNKMRVRARWYPSIYIFILPGKRQKK